MFDNTEEVAGLRHYKGQMPKGAEAAMAQTRMHIEGVLQSRAGRARLLTLAAALAVMAAVLVFRLLVMSAISMVSQERVLDCPYAGEGAHQHTAD